MGDKSILNEEISLYSIATIIAKNWMYLIISVVVFTVLAFVYVQRKPNVYTAKALIIPPQQQGNAASALLGAVSGLSGLGGGQAKGQNDILISMLQSKTLRVNLSKELGLTQILKLKTDGACADYIKSGSRFDLGKDGLLLIEVKDTNPEFAAKVANGYANQLQKLNDQVALNTSSQKREFMEVQFKTAQDELAKAEEAFQSLKKKSGIVDMESQGEASLKANIDLKNQYTAKQMELQNLRQTLASGSPQLKQAEAQVAFLQGQLAKMNQGDEGSSALLSKNKMLNSTLAYQRAFREFKQREVLFEAIGKQYAAAKMDEANQSGMIQVLDSAEVPKIPTGPRRNLYVIAGAVFGIVFGLMLIGFKMVIRRVRRVN